MVLMVFRPHGLLAVRSRREEEPAAAVVAQERAEPPTDGGRLRQRAGVLAPAPTPARASDAADRQVSRRTD